MRFDDILFPEVSPLASRTLSESVVAADDGTRTRPDCNNRRARAVACPRSPLPGTPSPEGRSTSPNSVARSNEAEQARANVTPVPPNPAVHDFAPLLLQRLHGPHEVA